MKPRPVQRPPGPETVADAGHEAAETALRAALAGAVESGLLPVGARILVAVSGGSDSVGLLAALLRFGPELGLGSLVAGHVDHGLRPDSGKEAEAVRALSGRLGVPCLIRKVVVRRSAGGVQAGARLARYAALEAMRESAGADCVATAHTADDQSETVLMRLCRGTSPAGLVGVRPKSGRVVRPVLGVRRATLATFRVHCGIEVREDPANADPRYVRARIRHAVLPHLEATLGPGVADALARFAALAADEDRYLRIAAAELAKRVGDPWGLDAAGLAAADPVLARRVLVAAWAEASGSDTPPVETAHVARLLTRLGEAAGWRLDLPGGVRATLSCGRLLFEGPGRPPASIAPHPIPGPGRYRIAGLSCEVLVRRRRRPVDPPPNDPHRAILRWPLDAPLTVRGWRPGDRLAGGGRISDLLARARVPVPLRPSVPVLLAGEAVSLVVGIRGARLPVRGPGLEIRFEPRAEANFPAWEGASGSEG